MAQHSNRRHQFHLETPTPNRIHFARGHVQVSGWCFDNGGHGAQEVSIRVGRRVYFCDRVSRHDICAADSQIRAIDADIGFAKDIPLGFGLKLLDIKAVMHGGQRLHLGYRVVLSKPQHQHDGYAQWVEQYDTLTKSDLANIKAHLEIFRQRPLFSVIMPTYNTPDGLLQSAIDSVRQQVYPNWELCIADDASTKPHLRKILEEYQRKDSRIKVVFRSTNGHISAATNSALELATGEFATFLDHDDVLRPHALYMIANEINQDPDAAVIYSDEDKIDATGRRSGPYFKPDWNPDLLLSQNYLCHLLTYRTVLIREVGGLREGYEGCQDWDLALRITERVAAYRIHHIPFILYHWRAVKGSTALAISEKGYVFERSIKTIEDHFRRIRVAADVTIAPQKEGRFGGRLNYIRIRRYLPALQPSVDLIIPTRNHMDFLRRAVHSILKRTEYPNYRIVIVDNDSDQPETLEFLESVTADSRISVLRQSGSFNFSRINNRTIAVSRADIIGLINNDVEVINGNWLTEMVSHAIRPEIGAVGAKLFYPNDTIQHAGVLVGLGGFAGHPYKHFPRDADGQAGRAWLVQNLSAVTAACLLIRRAVYLEVGGLDEENLTVALNDVDLCLRVRRAGYRNLFTPYAELYHHESVSRGYEDTTEKQARFALEIQHLKNTWGESLLHDPAYNPNLTLHSEDCGLAFPPRTKKPWKPTA